MTDKQRKNRGKPFKKGQSGNPKGRPPAGESLAELVRAGEKGRVLQAIDVLWAKAARGDIHAFAFLADRGWGKVPFPVEQSGPEGGPMKVVFEYADDTGD